MAVCLIVGMSVDGAKIAPIVAVWSVNTTVAVCSGTAEQLNESTSSKGNDVRQPPLVEEN